MFRWVDHTGEVELAIEAASREGVFADALAALSELLGGSEQDAPAMRTLSASGPDLAALLADWLSELVFLAETEGFVATRVDRLALLEHGLTADVAGNLASPPHLVKAVTYHGLTFEHRDDLWRATVVLDV
jgi:SHS2 domain-containing protein